MTGRIAIPLPSSVWHEGVKVIEIPIPEKPGSEVSSDDTVPEKEPDETPYVRARDKSNTLHSTAIVKEKDRPRRPSAH